MISDLFNEISDTDKVIIHGKLKSSFSQFTGYHQDKTRRQKAAILRFTMKIHQIDHET